MMLNWLTPQTIPHPQHRRHCNFSILSVPGYSIAWYRL